MSGALEQHCGHDVWVRRQGEGPQIRLFLHCSLASHVTLLPLDAALPEAQSVLFDLPGHGKSGPWDGQGDYQALVVAIAAQLLENATPAHVIGHSFGATAALHFALKYPACVSRLSLIDSVFFAAAKGTLAYQDHIDDFAPFIEAIERNDRGEAARVFLDMWGDKGGWARLTPAQQAEAAKRIHLITAGQASMEDDCFGQLATGPLDTLDCPVDLIEGGETAAVVHAINDTLSQRLPHVSRKRIDGAGHMVPITHAPAVAAALT